MELETGRREAEAHNICIQPGGRPHHEESESGVKAHHKESESGVVVLCTFYFCDFSLFGIQCLKRTQWC